MSRRDVLSFALVATLLFTAGCGATNNVKETKETTNNTIAKSLLSSIKPLPYLVTNKAPQIKPLNASINVDIFQQQLVLKEKQPEKLIYEVTSFTSGYESTGKRPGHPLYGVTASGKKAKNNHTLACPKSIDFGTMIYIPYFEQTFVCEDRGAAITEGHLDVYMSSLKKAKDFGRQQLEIKIVRSD